MLFLFFFQFLFTFNLFFLHFLLPMRKHVFSFKQFERISVNRCSCILNFLSCHFKSINKQNCLSICWYEVVLKNSQPNQDGIYLFFNWVFMSKAKRTLKNYVSSVLICGRNMRHYWALFSVFSYLLFIKPTMLILVCFVLERIFHWFPTDQY